jgi:LPS-assembly lipoprotein
MTDLLVSPGAMPGLTDPARRGGLRVACGLLVAPLAGCGFALRRPPVMPFRTVQLTGFKPNSPLELELRRNLRAAQGTQIVESAGQAEVIFEALSERREHTVVGSSAAGQVRNLNLRMSFRFRLRTVSGRELIAATELVLARDMSYTESAALAKEQEEDAIFLALQSDIVTQVIRRLSASPAP